MTTQEPKLTVHEALVAVMRDVNALGKNQRNTAPGGNYSFRGIDATMNAVGPALRTHSLAVIAACRSSEYGEILVGKDRRPMAHSRVVMEYTLVGPDGSTLTGSAPGEAFDAGDKATAKACSVAYRTWLLQTLCLPTDDPDPDQHSYERAAPQPLSEKTRGRMFALMSERGITEADAQRNGMSAVLGRPVESRGDLSEDEGRRIIASLEGAHQ